MLRCCVFQIVKKLLIEISRRSFWIPWTLWTLQSGLRRLQIGNSLRVYETNNKVKKVQSLSLAKIWPPSELLFLERSYCSCFDFSILNMRLCFFFFLLLLHVPCNYTEFVWVVLYLYYAELFSHRFKVIVFKKSP